MKRASRKRSRGRLDVVVPVFNEAEALPAFQQELAAVLGRLDYAWRVIFVDDGSSDATPQLLRTFRGRDRRMTWLRLSRNFGYQAALTAGLDAADADVVAMMDGDGQHPPAVLPEMVKLIEAGYDIVATSRIEAEGVGPLFLLFAMCEALYVVSLWLAGRGGEIAPGWSSLMFVLLIVGSALMVMLSIVGIYAGPTYQELKRRPVYLVQEAELQPSAGAPSSKGAKHAGQ